MVRFISENVSHFCCKHLTGLEDHHTLLDFIRSATSFRADCKTIILRCVEELLETEITEEQLIKNANTLSADQYSDVIEERNIEHLCGYPLCSTLMKSIPQQKYHVSVKNKQVYDLSGRKRFCSETCFKCSQYFVAQLSPLPLWSRTHSRAINIKFLMPKSSLPCSKGKQLPQSSPKQTTPSSKTQSQCSSKSQNIDSPTSSSQRNTHSSHSHTHPTQSHTPQLSELQKVDSDVNGEPYLIKQIDASASPFSNFSPLYKTFNLGVEVPKMSHDFTQLLKVPQVNKLLSAFSTWMSVPLNDLESSFQSNDGSQESCGRHMAKYDGGHSKFHDDNGEQKDGEEKESDDAPTPAKDVAVFLPLVDSVNVRQVQHKVFLSQMKKHLSVMCSELGLLFHTILPQVTITVSKFRFNRHCITFRPGEWKVILVLLIIISCGDDVDIIDNTLVNQWLQGINATREDFKLMLASFSTTE